MQCTLCFTRPLFPQRTFLHLHLLGNYTASVCYRKVLNIVYICFVERKVKLAMATIIPFFYIHDRNHTMSAIVYV